MINKKNCLITGCSGFIGKHIAHTLTEDSWNVFGTTTQKNNHDNTINWLSINFLDNNWLTDLQKKLEHIEINAIIHCAAISIDASLQKLEEKDIQTSSTINLQSIFKINQILQPQLKEAQIILIGSRVSKVGNAGQTLYAMAKGLMIDYTKHMAQVLGANHHKINLLIPGVHPSKILGEHREKVIQNAINESALRCTTNIQDVTNAVKFLLNSTSITGQVIEIESRFNN